VDLARNVAPVVARVDGDGLLLDGRLVGVPVGHRAERVVVPVTAGRDWWLVLLDPDSPGVGRESAVTTDRQIDQQLELHQVRVDRDDLMPVTAASVGRWLDQAITGLCALQLGVSERAIALTVEHVSTRRQFGREIATFQAVRMRAADAYLDLAAMRVTTSYAAGLLALTRPAATGSAASAAALAAKWWAAEAGHRCLHTALHLHGGIGNDLDYPLHRYFLWSRQLGLTLGGGAQQLERLSELVPSLLDSGL
jgi:alkylation response protein AidB-like acyl-CoA dehydrogenase